MHPDLYFNPIFNIIFPCQLLCAQIHKLLLVLWNAAVKKETFKALTCE